jgi:hypothetical protein
MGIDLEAVVGAYNLKYDLDNDRAVGTANDKAILAKVVVEMLSEVEYDDFADGVGNYNFNSIEEFVDYIALTIAYGIPA